ncbi:quinone oxidoreductase family protein [Palleronia abyssalis]|uniref:Quinone oxidoreductase 1 n=1 Tax=Palleronia abyssalis TaxID=1501240 RepID=A0A2R8BWP8_9RHOB|nr:quinone oxidoreductase [Palleronia abyssalis]SPJ24580.1 Quinone oxidoreductase 1 [Palleronia abyssalis]
MADQITAIRVHEYGGSDRLSVDSITLDPPAPGEARVRHRAIGLNFADIHNRAGRYPLPSLPHVLGGEAAGVVEAVGDGVTYVAPGDRVAYAAGGPAYPPGSYAEARNFPADRLIPLPDEIDDETAAGLVTKGLTAQYLLRGSYRVEPGQTILIHAAAGGVGSLLVQWAGAIGCRVIGVVSTEEKAEAVRKNGAEHVLLGHEDIAARVRSLTAGEGVPVVYDSVGKDTFDASLASLRPNGTLVAFGTASGPVPPLDLFRLNQMGSLHVTSAAFAWFMRDRRELLSRANELFTMLLGGKLKIEINQRYALNDAARAHDEIEARKTTGISILKP